MVFVWLAACVLGVGVSLAAGASLKATFSGKGRGKQRHVLAGNVQTLRCAGAMCWCSLLHRLDRLVLTDDGQMDVCGTQAIISL